MDALDSGDGVEALLSTRFGRGSGLFRLLGACTGFVGWLRRVTRVQCARAGWFSFVRLTVWATIGYFTKLIAS